MMLAAVCRHSMLVKFSKCTKRNNMASRISVTKTWTITINECTWKPDSKDVNGVSFIFIDSYDRMFYKLCFGSTLHWSKGHAAKLRQGFFAQLRQSRKHACDVALQAALAPACDGDAAPARPAKKRRNKDLIAKKVHHKFLPRVVTVSMDGFVDSEGTLPPRSFQMLTEEFTSKRKFWVEVNQENMEFIIRGIIHSHAAEREAAANNGEAVGQADSGDETAGEGEHTDNSDAEER